MQRNYKDSIYLAVNIIETCVKEEKDNDYIKDMIIEELNTNEFKVKDINYYDRRYFKPIKGITISETINNIRFARAVELYRKEGYPRLQKKATYKGISHFLEKYEKLYHKIKIYMVAEKLDLELHDWDYDFDWPDTKADDMILMKADSSESAIINFLSTKAQYQHEKVLKPEIIKNFWEDVSYGEMDGYQEFRRQKEILEIGDEIYTKYIENYKGDLEELYEKVDVESEMEKFYSLLTVDDKKELYFKIHRYDYVAIELTTFEEYKRKNEWNKNQLIHDTIREVLLFWDVLLELIRQDKTEKYYKINNELLRKKGFTYLEIESLLNVFRNRELKSSVSLENGCDFYMRSLFEIMSESWLRNNTECEMTILPLPIMFQLAEEDFYFIDGMTEKTITILSEILDLRPDFFN